MKLRSAILFALLVSVPAGAGTILQVDSPGALGPVSVVTWGTALDEGNSPASPYTRISSSGLAVTVRAHGRLPDPCAGIPTVLYC